MIINPTVLQFVEGKISFNEFYKEYYNNGCLQQWIEDAVVELGKQGIVITYEVLFRKSFGDDFVADMIEKGDLMPAIPTRNYPTVKSFIDWCSRQYSVYKRSSIYDIIYSIVVTIDPLMQPYDEYEKDFKFFTKAVPEYISGGDDTCDFIQNEIINKLSVDMKQTKRIQLCKEEIKRVFHIEKNKYPRWIQSAEWPLSKTGKPTKFLRQKNVGEVSYYYFLDMDTNEEIEVMQAY